MIMSEKFYTPEEIVSIKENLKRAFGRETIEVSLKLENLLRKKDKDKFEYIIGEQFVFWQPINNKELKIKKGWHIIEITYQRLNLIFFKVLSSENPNQEHYAEKDSYFTNNLIPVNVDIDRFGYPEQNLPLLDFDKGKGNPFDIFIVKENDNILKKV